MTRGSSVTTKVDGFGRTVSVENAEGVRTTFTYDAEGRRTFESLPHTGAAVGVTIAYDALGRVTSRTHSDGAAVTYGYNGLKVTVSDEEQRQTVQEWEAAGSPTNARLVAVVDADSTRWAYGYDTLGTLTSVKTTAKVGAEQEPRETTRTWTHNAKQQLESELHPESGTTSYLYDEAGNLTTRTDAAGNSVEYVYDGNNRVKTATEKRGTRSEVTTFVYQAGWDLRREVAGPYGTTTYTYDRGRLDSREDVIDGHTFTSSYGYDDNDNLIKVVYPSGRLVVGYEYDQEHRPTKACDLTAYPGSTTCGNAPRFVGDVQYHPAGALSAFKMGPANTTYSASFSPNRQWPTAIASGPMSLGYTEYDATGNLKTITDGRGAAWQQTFTYDSLDRLETASGAYGSLSFAYDAHGNRVGGNTPTYDGSTMRLTQVQTGAGLGDLSYHANGDLKRETVPGAGTLEYGYTAGGLLRSVGVVGSGETVTALAAYDYDGDGQRVVRVTRAGTVYSIRDGRGRILSEFVGAAQGAPAWTRDYLYFGDRLLGEFSIPPLATAGLGVELTSPGAILEAFEAPATIPLAARVYGAAPVVDFFSGTRVIKAVTATPQGDGWVADGGTWSKVPAGHHALSARVRDAANTVARSGNLVVRVIAVGRLVSLGVFPPEPPVGQPTPVTFYGIRPCSNLRVSFGDGSEETVMNESQDLPATTTHTWAVQGTYDVRAEGVGSCRQTITRTITVGPPNVPPVVTLLWPPPGQELAGPPSVVLAAQADDPDGVISEVEFVVDGVVIGRGERSYAEEGLPPYEVPRYSVSWIGPSPGPHQVWARAIDVRNGQAVSAQSPITVTMLSGVTVPAEAEAGTDTPVTVTGLAGCGAVGLDFGDGSGYVVHRVTQLPYTTSHTWMTAGAYTVRATGEGGCTGTVTATVLVTGTAPPPSVVTAVVASQATWSVGQTVSFTVSGRNPCGAVFLQFGEGEPQFLPIAQLPVTVTRVYTTPGVKTVTASGMAGCGGQATTTVTIQQ